MATTPATDQVPDSVVRRLTVEMPNEHRIRALARNIFQAGLMPRRDPDGTWGGKGVDVPCAICGERIGPDQLEYELQFGQEGATPDVDLFHLHLRCFAAWEMERTKAASDSDTP
jgi:hypothetical protein